MPQNAIYNIFSSEKVFPISAKLSKAEKNNIGEQIEAFSLCLSKENSLMTLLICYEQEITEIFAR